MNITNERPVMVFKKDNKYSIGISKKKQDGSYENAYIKVEFNKNVELEDRTMIKIKHGWLSFYNWEYQGNKGTTWVIRCNEFEKVEEYEKDPMASEIKINKVEQKKDPFEEFGESIKTESNIGEQIKIEPEDLPW